MDNEDFEIETGETYTAIISWDGENEDGSSRFTLILGNGEKIPLDDKLGERMGTYEGWKLDFKIH